MNITLYDLYEKSNGEFKKFKKYIESLIRWSDVSVDVEGMKTYFKKLGLDGKNTEERLYTNPKTGISMNYRMHGNDLIFILCPDKS